MLGSCNFYLHQSELKVVRLKILKAPSSELEMKFSLTTVYWKGSLAEQIKLKRRQWNRGTDHSAVMHQIQAAGRGKYMRKVHLCPVSMSKVFSTTNTHHIFYWFTSKETEKWNTETAEELNLPVTKPQHHGFTLGSQLVGQETRYKYQKCSAWARDYINYHEAVPTYKLWL